MFPGPMIGGEKPVQITRAWWSRSGPGTARPPNEIAMLSIPSPAASTLLPIEAVKQAFFYWTHQPASCMCVCV